VKVVHLEGKVRKEVLAWMGDLVGRENKAHLEYVDLKDFLETMDDPAAPASMVHRFVMLHFVNIHKNIEFE